MLLVREKKIFNSFILIKIKCFYWTYSSFHIFIVCNQINRPVIKWKWRVLSLERRCTNNTFNTQISKIVRLTRKQSHYYTYISLNVSWHGIAQLNMLCQGPRPVSFKQNINCKIHVYISFVELVSAITTLAFLFWHFSLQYNY